MVAQVVAQAVAQEALTASLVLEADPVAVAEIFRNPPKSMVSQRVTTR